MWILSPAGTAVLSHKPVYLKDLKCAANRDRDLRSSCEKKKVFERRKIRKAASCRFWMGCLVVPLRVCRQSQILAEADALPGNFHRGRRFWRARIQHWMKLTHTKISWQYMTYRGKPCQTRFWLGDPRKHEFSSGYWRTAIPRLFWNIQVKACTAILYEHIQWWCTNTGTRLFNMWLSIEVCIYTPIPIHRGSSPIRT